MLDFPAPSGLRRSYSFLEAKMRTIYVTRPSLFTINTQVAGHLCLILVSLSHSHKKKDISTQHLSTAQGLEISVIRSELFAFWSRQLFVGDIPVQRQCLADFL